MKKLALLFLVLALLPVSHAFAEGEKVITLKDGSRISGRIIGIDQGRYVIQSGTLGEVRIGEDNIQSIVAPNMAATTNTQPGQDQAAGQGQTVPGEYTQNMKAMQAQIMSNPDIMKEIATLAEDPEILRLLNDPALLEAATKGNPQAMQANPRTHELMNNPKMQELIKKVEQTQAGQPAPQP
jgi:hypothetical protein